MGKEGERDRRGREEEVNCHAQLKRPPIGYGWPDVNRFRVIHQMCDGERQTDVQ